MTHSCPACEFVEWVAKTTLAEDSPPAWRRQVEQWSAIKARHATAEPQETPCKNCGKAGHHYAPPSFGDTGHYTCATAEPALPEGVEIVECDDGWWDVRTKTHWLSESRTRGLSWEVSSHNYSSGIFRSKDRALAAALKAPPPPRPVTPNQVIVTEHPNVPELKQGVCAGCGVNWGDDHIAGCQVQAKTEGLMPPTPADGDGLEAAVNGTLHAHWLATTYSTVGVRDAVVELIRSQIAKATAELRRERDELRKEVADILHDLNVAQKEATSMEAERDALAERLRAATRTLEPDEQAKAVEIGRKHSPMDAINWADATRKLTYLNAELRAGKEQKHGT